jgi:hypothetical protein
LKNSYNTELNITDIITLGNKIIISGMNSKTINLIKIYDIRNLKICEHAYESPLKYETHSMCAMNNSDGFVLSGYEGKIAVEYMKNLLTNSTNNNLALLYQNYSFKCHREETETNSIIHSVNTVAFHPR